MDIKFSKRLIQPVNHLSKIHGIAWSPNNKIIAVAYSHKKLSLFDEQGNLNQNISTLSSIQGNYEIIQILFNPESSRLAIILNNKVILIYDINSNKEELKSKGTIIRQIEKPNCMIWSKVKTNTLIFGDDRGNIKLCLLNNEKTNTLYTYKHSCVSISSSLDGKFIISGHKDYSVCIYNLENKNNKKLFVHSCIPTCLTWGINSNIFAAGNNARVVIYNDIGNVIKNFDYSNDNDIKEFYSCSICNSGDAIALGNFNSCYFYLYNKKNNSWNNFMHRIDNYSSVSAICWKPDKTALVTGNLMKSVDLFTVSILDDIKELLFDIKQVSDNQIVIKNNKTQKSYDIISMSSKIIKYDIYLNNYLVCYGNESLILGNLDQEKYSEIDWIKTGHEEFDFSNNIICIVRNNEGLSLSEYGINDILNFYPTNKKEESDLNKVKDQYFQELILINQFDKAAQLKENDKDYKTAIDLYIKAKNPLKAENLFKQYYNENNFDINIYKKILESLNQAGLSDKSKEFMEFIEQKGQKQNKILKKNDGKYERNEDYSKENEVEKAIKEKNITKAIELMNKYQDINISFYIDIGKYFEEKTKLQ